MNIKTILIASTVSLLATIANADIKIGISASAVELTSTGTETLKSSSNTTNAEVNETLVIPSIFAEVGELVDGSWSVGFDYVPVQELGKASRVKPDIDTNDDADTAGTNTAQAEIASHVSLYVTKMIGTTPLYLKGGVSHAKVNTAEALETGSSYGDTNVSGFLLGLGLHKQSASGFFGRIEGTYTDYGDLQLTSSVDADSVSNKVNAEIEAYALRIAVGKSF